MTSQQIIATEAPLAARASQHRWDVITCEYPPRIGGVADYTYQVASGLAQEGDEVHVWCPASDLPPRSAEGITVHCLSGTFSSKDLELLGEELDRASGARRLLVQWVPQGFGYRSMNVGLCWWLWRRAAQGDRVEIVAHELFLPFPAGSLLGSAAALVQRFMALILLRAASRVWTSTPSWERYWRGYALGRQVRFEWLPIPSNIPAPEDAEAGAVLHQRYAGKDRFLIGHFGTFGSAVTSLLEPILVMLDGDTANQVFLLIGSGSERFRQELIRKQPALEGRIHATGALNSSDLSRHLAACDMLIQPYPDGVSTRRTSVMAGILQGKPVVTTCGVLTEPVWSETGAVTLAPAGETNRFVDCVRALRDDRAERVRAGESGRRLYRERFDISHTIRTLRQSAQH